jgi:hypothetical protein
LDCQGTSQQLPNNQAYHQLKAKRDKAKMQPLVDLVAKYCGVIDQFQLTAIMVQALNQGQPEDWINSFISVNMYPKHHLPFQDWLLRKIASCI